MEWIELFNSVIDYIEEHLDDDISNEEIGRLVACSVGSFKRTFSLLSGITLSEYIRRRKMTMAAFEVQSTNTKVIDIATKYGYESADAFTVAFKRMHGVTPMTVRQQSIKVKSYPCMTFSLTITGNEAMDYKVVDKEAFRVCGKVATSCLENDIISQFWNKCKKDGTVNRLLEIGIKPCTLGMCFEYSDDGYYDYLVGTEINRDYVEGMEIHNIPKSTWLVFEANGPKKKTLPVVWKRIYGEFLPQSIYKQATMPTMEVYCGDDITAEDFSFEVWIPVVRS